MEKLADRHIFPSEAFTSNDDAVCKNPINIQTKKNKAVIIIILKSCNLRFNIIQIHSEDLHALVCTSDLIPLLYKKNLVRILIYVELLCT